MMPEAISAAISKQDLVPLLWNQEVFQKLSINYRKAKVLSLLLINTIAFSCH